jgi:hypothetical protein
VIDDELSRTQRVCEAVGDESLSAELWQTVVTLSDEWIKYQRLHARSPTFSAACDTGNPSPITAMTD